MKNPQTQNSINTFKHLFRICEFQKATSYEDTNCGRRIHYKVIVLITSIFDALVAHGAQVHTFILGKFKGEKFIQVNGVMFMRDNHTYQKYVSGRFKESKKKSSN